MRIKNKKEEIEKYVYELEEIMPDNFEEYKKNFEKKAACERYFEKIIEALTDFAFLIIKKEKFTIPEDDKKSFDTLSAEKIITYELCTKLKNAKGMRNIIAHEYGKIDDSLVFESITTEIVSDTQKFIKAIERFTNNK